MRHAPITLALLLVIIGCNQFRPFHNGGGIDPPPQKLASQPTAESLVNYLNDNARRLQSVDCGDLTIDAHAGSEGVTLVDCWMVCSKPRNFRMTAKILGSQGVDMGSNDSEFWWWISKSEPPYLFHCSYEDFGKKQVPMPFPFQPEWIMEGLGMAEYGPPEKYTVNATQNTVELVEQTTTPQGAQVRKVTVFSRTPPRTATAPVVTAHLLQDANGKIICGAYITEVQRDANSGAVLPKKLRLEWPQQRMELKMTLNKATVNRPIDQQRTARLFTRPQMQGVQTYDLASVRDPGQAVRRTGGEEPRR